MYGIPDHAQRYIWVVSTYSFTHSSLKTMKKFQLVWIVLVPTISPHFAKQLLHQMLTNPNASRAWPLHPRHNHICSDLCALEHMSCEAPINTVYRKLTRSCLNSTVHVVSQKTSNWIHPANKFSRSRLVQNLYAKCQRIVYAILQ